MIEDAPLYPLTRKRSFEILLRAIVLARSGGKNFRLFFEKRRMFFTFASRKKKVCVFWEKTLKKVLEKRKRGCTFVAPKEGKLKTAST